MQEVDNIADNDPVHDLTGVRLRIFCYLLQQDGTVGVRQTQRALNLKSASHANYHLQKLVDDHIAEQNVQNEYYLLDKYKVKSVQVNVLTEYYLLAGRFWPRTVFFASYLLISIIIALVLQFTGALQVLQYYLLISLFLSFVVAAYEVNRQMELLPWDTSNNTN